MSGVAETRHHEDAASRLDPMERWLAASEPLAVDEDGGSEASDSESSADDPAA